MDQFLATHGASPILKPGTNTSFNSGKLVVDTQYKNIANLLTPYCRVAACSLDRPRVAPAAPGQPPNNRETYFTRLLFNPNGVGEIVEAVMLLANTIFQPITLATRQYSIQERFGLPKDQGGLHYPLYYGDVRASQDPVKNADYAGVLFLNASMPKETGKGTPQRPVVLDAKGNPADPNIIFPGCYVRATVTLFAYSNNFGGGISVRLSSIQFAAPGPRMLSTWDAVGAAQTAAAEAGEITFGGEFAAGMGQGQQPQMPMQAPGGWAPPQQAWTPAAAAQAPQQAWAPPPTAAAGPSWAPPTVGGGQFPPFTGVQNAASQQPNQSWAPPPAAAAGPSWAPPPAGPQPSTQQPMGPAPQIPGMPPRQ